LVKNNFWDFENFWGWVTLDDLDLEPVKISCEKNFWSKFFLGSLKIFGGDLDPEPEKNFSEKNF